ncbi:MAG: DNA cytosine methyltransferase [Pirellulaceae bacterium]|nr:DNA cytosine methyltransferase [Pirellulaceae bacterium]
MRKINSNAKITAVDLFCGAGGLTKGLEKSGVNVKLGVDVDHACEYPYTQNNQADFLLKSVDDLKSEEVNNAFEGAKFKLLAGCAPCQTFSSYNQKADSSDKRWWLLLQFSRLIQEVKPELVTMENVPGLTEQDVFNQFVSGLKEQGYYTSYQIVKCDDYGLPQHRNRLVLLASKLGPITLLSPKEFNRKPKTVKQAIGRLPEIEAGEIHAKDSLHQCSSLSELNYKRIVASKQGGTWRDWPKKLVAKCHQKKSGKTYPGVYGRMSWDKPSPTITTQFFGFGNGRFGHPEQNRAISLREGAILQSFPKSYKFSKPGKPIGKKNLGRMIGNAVPVVLGEVIGESTLKHVENNNERKTAKI